MKFFTSSLIFFAFIFSGCSNYGGPIKEKKLANKNPTKYIYNAPIQEVRKAIINIFPTKSVTVCHSRWVMIAILRKDLISIMLKK